MSRKTLAVMLNQAREAEIEEVEIEEACPHVPYAVTWQDEETIYKTRAADWRASKSCEKWSCAPWHQADWTVQEARKASA